MVWGWVFISSNVRILKIMLGLEPINPAQYGTIGSW